MEIVSSGIAPRRRHAVFRARRDVQAISRSDIQLGYADASPAAVDGSADEGLDQRVFALHPEQSAAFANVLDNPPKPNAALKALMKRPGPWA